MKPIEMLSEVLKRAQLSARERESFEDMYDRIHRFKRCSDKQKAWIEKVYFGQQLDRQVSTPRRRVVIPTWQRSEDTAEPRVSTQAAETPTPTPTRQVLLRRRPGSGTFVATPMAAEPLPHQVGYINYAGVSEDVLVTNLLAFEEVCPRIRPGSKQHATIAKFFARGGIVVKVKPLQSVQSAQVA